MGVTAWGNEGDYFGLAVASHVGYHVGPNRGGGHNGGQAIGACVVVIAASNEKQSQCGKDRYGAPKDSSSINNRSHSCYNIWE